MAIEPKKTNTPPLETDETYETQAPMDVMFKVEKQPSVTAKESGMKRRGTNYFKKRWVGSKQANIDQQL